MNDDDIQTVKSGLTGCAAGGCILYLIGFLLLIIFIVIFAMISTPNPYG